VGNGDVLDIVVHKNIRISNVTVSDNLDSDHLPIVFHFLDLVRTIEDSEALEKFTDWEQFQNLTSNLISPNVSISTFHLLNICYKVTVSFTNTRDESTIPLAPNS
jgi:hypothetical protein